MAVYRARLATGRAGLLALVRALFGAMFDPERPIASLGMLGAIAGAAIVRGQLSAVTAARTFLFSISGPPAWQAPAGLVGSTARGLPLVEVTGKLPAVYWARILGGWGPDAARDTAQASLSALAASEPYRVANAAVLGAALYDERYTGRFDRLTRAGSCPFCRLIADRGYTEAAAGFAAHANCQCVAAPEMRPIR